MSDNQPPNRTGGIASSVSAVLALCILAGVGVGALLFVFFPGFYASESTARRAIENAGFTEVQMNTNHWIFPRLWGGCGDEDTIAWEARVKNAQGQWVRVTACGTLFWKNYTIRINK